MEKTQPDRWRSPQQMTLQTPWLIQATGVDGTAYAAKLPGSAMTVVILNKDAVRDLDLTFDFGAGKRGTVR
jgi:hypothetical protein